MIEYEPIAYGTRYGPADDDEDWETIYPEGFREEQEAPEESVKPMEEEDIDGFVDNWQELMDIADAVDDGTLKGEAEGNKIVSVVASHLVNSQKYGYAFEFWRLKEE